MRKFLVIVILAAVGSLVFSQINKNYLNEVQDFFSYSPCDHKISYKIGIVDSQFKLSERAFLTYVQQAVQLWNTAAGRQLFVYDPKGVLTVNLIFDERQSLTNKITNETNQVQSQKESLNPKVEEYNTKVANFKQQLSDFKQQVSYWNNQGGAPPDEYRQLTAEQDKLKQEADNINQLAQNLNLSADVINAEIGNLNQTITAFNETLVGKPEEGIYKSALNEIDIYFNISRDELVHTLAHEFGHARGLQHLTNPNAVMYSRTNTQLKPTADDLTELDSVCQKFGVLESIRQNLLDLIQKFRI